ncbi:hypothetical protein G436_4799 [Leptospira interrogans serovar Hardjo str. Norma]|uniref:Uncharacterized protein n=1 Tax=Leptospira interrogans serovar Hardjo str. Norma TaxID=1279460 RepID=A0A0M4P0X2_LEPIR|nr:hypothetical protein G436_4799 [Leptospira interrogans serovar Hardjo str. Norma]
MNLSHLSAGTILQITILRTNFKIVGTYTFRKFFLTLNAR